MSLSVVRALSLTMMLLHQQGFATAKFAFDDHPSFDHPSVFDATGTLNPEQTLMAELEKAEADRRSAAEVVVEASEILRPIFDALPKTPTGGAGPQAASYALHRYFSEKRGWRLQGLQDGYSGRHSAVLGDVFQGRLEESSMDFFNDLLNGPGVSLRELALLAATLERVVVKDMVMRLEQAYQQHAPQSGISDPEDVTQKVFETYLMYNIIGLDVPNVTHMLPMMGDIYPEWNNTVALLRPLVPQVSLTKSQEDDNEVCTQETLNSAYVFDSEGATQAVVDIAKVLATLQEQKCQKLAKELEFIEGRDGRVHVDRFFTGDTSMAQESMNHLSAFGALDESNPEEPHVLIPNYVLASTNCGLTSGLAKLCCTNQCDNLMAKLETELKASKASVPQLTEAVEKVSGQSVSRAFTQQLETAASGEVQLHGHVFGKFLHSVFPRICPQPQVFDPANTDLANDLNQAHVSVAVVTFAGDIPYSVDADLLDLEEATEDEVIATQMSKSSDTTSGAPIESQKTEDVPAPGMSRLSVACMILAVGGMVLNLANSIASARKCSVGEDVKTKGK